MLYSQEPWHSKSVRRSSCHSQRLCSKFVSEACICSQLTPLSAPTCSPSPFNRLLLLVQQPPQEPKCTARAESASGFCTPLELLLEPRVGFHGEILQHLGHQAVAWVICLVLHHVSSCSKDSVDGDLNCSFLPSNQTVSSASLFSNPLRLHLRGLVAASSAVGLHLFRPLFSVFTGSSSDPDFLCNKSLRNHASRWRFHSGIKLSSGYLCSFFENFPQDRIPALCRRHLLVLGCRHCCLDLRHRTFQPHLQSLQAPFLSIIHPIPRPIRTENQLLKFLSLNLRFGNPRRPAPPFPFFTLESFPSIFTTAGK